MNILHLRTGQPLDVFGYSGKAGRFGKHHLSIPKTDPRAIGKKIFSVGGIVPVNTVLFTLTAESDKTWMVKILPDWEMRHFIRGMETDFKKETV